MNFFLRPNEIISRMVPPGELEHSSETHAGKQKERERDRERHSQSVLHLVCLLFLSAFLNGPLQSRGCAHRARNREREREERKKVLQKQKVAEKKDKSRSHGNTKAQFCRQNG